METARHIDCVKLLPGIEVGEYFSENNPFPLDCAVVKISDGQYPRKINHGFYEMFYVLEGSCEIDFGDDILKLSPKDVYVISPEKTHTIRAKFVRLLVVCTPPFALKNVEFIPDQNP
ncbi:MAG: AraC family ligand binding domain-containing protein [Puniceicoccales bacterium]|jgi:mannose-6-phosphate isomerase-like protein (cupin superfamily)|nr:AraC family ligand binding domain-containing protein [Puniceicoccales bacterium]